jgi:hypothetical protein
LHIGSAPGDLTQRSTFLCAEHVLPHLRPIWREYEDRWWPTALPATQRVQPREPNGDARPAAASADQTVRP